MDELSELLGNGSWQLSLLAYSITHGVLALRARRVGSTDRHYLVFGFATFFQGPFDGGPYQLRVGEQKQDGKFNILVEDLGGEFVLLASDVRLGNDSDHDLIALDSRLP